MIDLTNKEYAKILDDLAYWYGQVHGPGGPRLKQRIYQAAERLRNLPEPKTK